jgi:hypothetical protein
MAALPAVGQYLDDPALGHPARIAHHNHASVAHASVQNAIFFDCERLLIRCEEKSDIQRKFKLGISPRPAV